MRGSSDEKIEGWRREEEQEGRGGAGGNWEEKQEFKDLKERQRGKLPPHTHTPPPPPPAAAADAAGSPQTRS